MPWMNMLCLKQDLLTGVFLSSVERPVRFPWNWQQLYGHQDTRKPSGTLAVSDPNQCSFLLLSWQPQDIQPNPTNQATYLPACLRPSHTFGDDGHDHFHATLNRMNSTKNARMACCLKPEGKNTASASACFSGIKVPWWLCLEEKIKTWYHAEET